MLVLDYITLLATTNAFVTIHGFSAVGKQLILYYCSVFAHGVPTNPPLFNCTWLIDSYSIIIIRERQGKYNYFGWGFFFTRPQWLKNESTKDGKSVMFILPIRLSHLTLKLLINHCSHMSLTSKHSSTQAAITNKSEWIT